MNAARVSRALSATLFSLLWALAGCGGSDELAPDAAVDAMVPVDARAPYVPRGPQCRNRVDDDGDGLIDAADPGCTERDDEDEADPPVRPTCSNGLDDDGDGAIDLDDDDCAYAGNAEGRRRACVNGVDDDGDGLVDADDPGCADARDSDEADPPEPPDCANGLDDDADGFIDRADLDCAYAGAASEGPPAACDNGRDDDRDRFADDDDPGCTGPGDDDETDPAITPTCADGVDNDRDGLIDSEDDDCPYAGLEEGIAPACDNRRDDDGDGLIDAVDPGCTEGDDDDETDPERVPSCANGLDDDGDGAVDRVDRDCRYAGGSEGAPARCADGLDDDGDGLVDAEDPGCAGPEDDDERDPPVSSGCSNGVDDDLDGLVDLADDDCVYAGGEEAAAPSCGDGLDNDGDGRIDRADPGCTDEHDGDEADPAVAPVCANGLDDDADGRVDYPDDPDCARAGSGDEGRPAACANGLDDDADGRADLLDAGCVGADDDDERDPAAPPACANGLDDDADGRVDYPADPDCAAAGTDDEGRPSACANGLDDDADGAIDGDDPGCATRGDDDEADPPEPPACNNGLDDDLDGAIDRDDPDCALAGGEREGPAPACADGVDDDGDGLIDLADPGCARADDDDERDPPVTPGCADGLDNDADGLVDDADPDCVAAGAEEGPAPACANGLDDDADGRIDADDPGCASSEGDDEADPPAPPACANGLDDDADGAIDRADPGCPFAGGDDEGPRPACDNGLDDDADGRTDADDPGCGAAADDDEADPPRAPACANGLDDDADGRADRDDPDCVFAGLDDEGAAPACGDGIDNDDDGRVDADDPGCVAAVDRDERDPATPPGCANGLDDDADGRIDREDDDCAFAGAIEGATPACANGFDDDDDGRIDAVDPGCRHERDDSELDPPTPPACANGLDDDADGAVDFPADADCLAAGADREGPAAACANGVDDDADGLTDRFDPGCTSPVDSDEADPLDPPICANGLDDDADGAIDHPADPGCVAAGSDDEGPAPACADGLDNDRDGRVDLADNGCTDPTDDDEARPPLLPACGNGIDDDADGLVDYPRDLECTAAGADSEGPRAACIDGRDNDGDGRIDLADPGCVEPADDDEADPPARPACANGLDDDGDGAVDYPADANCVAAGFGDEALGSVCGDLIDNDGDGLIDDDDPGCADPFDLDEADVFPRPRCANRVDDDGDGLVDHPDDPDCPRASAETEGLICAPEAPTVAVGLVDAARVQIEAPEGEAVLDIGCGAGAGREVIIEVTVPGPGRMVVDPEGAPVRVEARAACADRFSRYACATNGEAIEFDVREGGLVPVLVQWTGPQRAPIEVRLTFDDGPDCGNGRDDDGDGHRDLSDPGCLSLADESERDPLERPSCANGLDDDGDGAIDYPDDLDCGAAGRSEDPHPCPGLGGDVIDVGPERSDVILEYDTDWPRLASGVYAADMVRVSVDVPSRLRVDQNDHREHDFTVQTRCDGVPLRSLRSSSETFVAYVPPGEYLIITGPGSLDPLPRRLELTIEAEPLTTLACANARDDDGDGRVDAADPGCNWLGDDDETDPLGAPGCADGLDDDGDGAIDHPLDPDCVAAGRVERAGSCGYDRPVGPPLGMGAVDISWLQSATLTPFAGVTGDCARAYPYVHASPLHLERRARVEVDYESGSGTLLVRRDCEDPASEVACLPAAGILTTELEAGDYTLLFVSQNSARVRADITIEPVRPELACINGLDDDGDGAIDLDDPGCISAADDDERDPPTPPACADGVDNDGNGMTDYPDDIHCEGAGDLVERRSCAHPQPAVMMPVPLGESRFDIIGDARRPVSACSQSGWFGAQTYFFDLDAPATLDVRVEGVEGGHRFDFACPALLSCLRGDIVGMRLEPGTHVFRLTTARPDDDGVVTLTLTPTPPPQCANGRDDDEDGLIDRLDPGCLDPTDDDELDPIRPLACADGIDNDGDGAIDYPDDIGCDGPGGFAEGQQCPDDVPRVDLGAAGGVAEFQRVPSTRALLDACSNGSEPQAIATIDVDVPSRLTVGGSGRPPALRRHCSEPRALTCDARDVPIVRPGSYAIIGRWFGQGPASLDVQLEPIAPLDAACLNGVDDDGDGLVDLTDSGCAQPDDDDEADDGVPPCDNGLDDDGDGHIDYPDDPDCAGAGDREEAVVDGDTVHHVRLGGFALELDERPTSIDIWLPRGGVLRAETVDSMSYDARLRLEDADGLRVVEDSDSGPGLDARLTSGDLLPGHYTLEVTPAAMVPGAGTTVVVEVEPLPIP